MRRARQRCRHRADRPVARLRRGGLAALDRRHADRRVLLLPGVRQPARGARRRDRQHRVAQRRLAFPMRLAYDAAKAAVAQMTQVLAIEWADHGIRVNAVGPGVTRTTSSPGRCGRHVDERVRGRAHADAPIRPSRRDRQGRALPRLRGGAELHHGRAAASSTEVGGPSAMWTSECLDEQPTHNLPSRTAALTIERDRDVSDPRSARTRLSRQPLPDDPSLHDHHPSAHPGGHRRRGLCGRRGRRPARDRRDHHARDRAAPDRRGRLRRRALLGARASGHLGHPARPPSRARRLRRVDTAIWDAVGKALGQPLWRLWGGYRTGSR